MGSNEEVVDIVASGGDTSSADEQADAFHKDEPGRGEGKGRGGKSGGGGKKGGPKERETQVSKALSKILRHQAESQGLKLDEEGYVRVDDLLRSPSLKSLKLTLPEIRNVVGSNEKKRFTLKFSPLTEETQDTTATSTTSENTSDYLIRANQGHTIAIESAALLSPITLKLNNVPATVIHGTYYAFYPMIASSGGLKPMGRNHVHFSTGLPEEADGVISGMRNDAEVLFYIDVQKSLEDNAALWWISDNGVVLTEGGENGMVESKYWKKVVGRRQDVGVLWENGAKVAELPHSVKNRKAPIGKSPRGKINGRGGGSGAKGVTGRARGMSEKLRQTDIDIAIAGVEEQEVLV